MSVFSQYQSRYEESAEEEYTLQEYLEICKSDPMAYATASERMLAAIGEPEIVDTAKDPRRVPGRITEHGDSITEGLRELP